MKYSSFNQGLPAGNPIANALIVFVGALAIGLSLVLGFLAFIVLASIVAVLGAVIGLRIWWLNRKLARRARAPGPTRNDANARVIEGEYHVVKRGEKT